MRSWPEFLRDETLFGNAIRLRYLLWMITDYVPAGARILEVGFGSGTAAVLLCDLGYRVSAIDKDPSLVERLAARYADWVRLGRLDVHVADMLALPWKSREFNLAYHQGVLEHCSDAEIVLALREQARVAKSVIFDVPSHRYRAQPLGNERLLSRSRWRELIVSAGLRVVAEAGRGFHRHMYALPHVLFSRRALETLPWFSRTFGVNFIFVCAPNES